MDTTPTPEGRRIHNPQFTSTSANEESGWKRFPLSHSSFLSSPASRSSFSLSIFTMDSRITPKKVLRGGVVNKVSSMEYFCHCQIGVIIYLGLCKSKELEVSTEHTSLFLALSVLHRTSGEEEMKEDSIIGKQDCSARKSRGNGAQRGCC